jgi:peptide/nickel transport system substrate-binding protein
MDKLTRRSVMATSAALALLPRVTLGQTARRGGILRCANDVENANWNPAIVASNGVFAVSRKVVETLFDLAADMRSLTPALATAWQPSADSKTHTFTLRANVKWHDGRDFTSADVAFSAMRCWKELQNFGTAVFRNLEAVDTPNATTAVFRFAQPIPSQLLSAALPALSHVVPRHIYEGGDAAAMRANPANAALVGTGPFRWGEHRRGEFIRLNRNTSYWNTDQPYLEGIVFRVMPDSGAKAAALESGDLELVTLGGVSIEDMQRLNRLPTMQAVSTGYEALLYTSILELNLTRPELQNVKVRHALAHAMNPDQAVDTVFGGFAKVSPSPIPTTDPVFHDPGVARYPYDPQKAEAMLDEAGYRRGANGMRFAMRIVPAPFFEQTRRIGELMRTWLRAVGIDATIVNLDNAGYNAAVFRDKAFDISSGVYVHRQDPAISTTALYATGTPAGVPFSNQRGYQSADMDRILNTALAETNAERRVQLYRDFQRLALTDLPLIPFVEFPLLSVASRKLQNHHDNPRWAVSGWGNTWIAA